MSYLKKGHLMEAMKIKDLVETLKKHLRLKIVRVALGNGITMGFLNIFPSKILAGYFFPNSRMT